MTDTFARPLANQNTPGSRYDPDRDQMTIKSGDTDFHEPDCPCKYCTGWHFWRTQD